MSLAYIEKCKEKEYDLSHIEKRQEQVKAILKRHSLNLFAHENATVKEIREESIKRNLESVFLKG